MDVPTMIRQIWAQFMLKLIQIVFLFESTKDAVAYEVYLIVIAYI